MNKMMEFFSIVAVAGLAVTMVWAGAPGGGAGRGGAGRGGRGNSGDVAPSNNPSAKSLSTPSTPTAPTDTNGFIKRWSILEPINGISGSGQNTFHPNALKEYFPGQMTVLPKHGEKVTVNGTELTWHAVDSKNHNVSLVHLANDLGMSSANGSLFWVVTVVNCPEEMKDVRLAIGSNDASVWWVNGQEACSIYGDILSYPDDAVSKRLTLKKGPNIVRGAVHNDRGQTDFCVRFLNEESNPITNITVSLSK
jgi:hypothetical protein